MGKFKDGAAVFCKKTKKLAKEAWSYRYDAVDVAVCFLAGIGLGNLLLDISGITRYSEDLIREEGRRKGYRKGFNDGMSTAARVIGVANNGGKPVTYPKSKA